ncbi:efflux RND transporter periplasmic adaptor subunit [Reichenbachiella agariperforans]|uniref:efflux RND transporter periplasmic adaptor subunit n=1 Tax=Reichenbachiella agariperforans TaxID=156994 RepID=UPI001C097C23|nr:efflux RND transporter periplasmic adaptor subunit [Reichenbachiella agariperforans]MBU2913616.1 efflux RND transporter periplasmic adaptor subunit [Reichenbachiella agariperforans]
MKKVLKYLAIVIALGGVAFATNFFIQSNSKTAETFETETAFIATIQNESVATGKVIPEQEVEIKPQLSGIVDKVYVKEGTVIKTGELIAKIKVVPNEASLNSAEGRVKNAQIVLKNAKIDFERNQKLYEKGIIADQAYNVSELNHSQAIQELENARNDLKIIKEGTAGGGATNTLIRATVPGTILEIPIEEGDQVIESNNFNEGTTIATIADLTKMIFEGKVDEADVSKLKMDMPLVISLAAIKDNTFDAKLRFIAPKGTEESGTVQFTIEADVFLDEGFFIRAGYSANATMVLDSRDSVLSIKEVLLQFDKETNDPYVEIETADQVFERKDVELGLSDGINVEILSGVTDKDKIKVWNKTEPVKRDSQYAND